VGIGWIARFPACDDGIPTHLVGDSHESKVLVEFYAAQGQSPRASRRHIGLTNMRDRLAGRAVRIHSSCRQ
jgi:hypothetical protein